MRSPAHRAAASRKHPGRGDAWHGVIAKRKRPAGGRRANRLQSRSGNVVSMIRVLALLLTVLTGFSALVYEVAWQKYLATLLGSHSEATAAVLGIFLGGLAAGYALFGRATRAWLARARAAGAPRGCSSPTASSRPASASTRCSSRCSSAPPRPSRSGSRSGSSGLGFAFDVLLSALLIGPPAVLMGGTIPILTLALARDLEDATRVHAWSTASTPPAPSLGALAAGFWLVPPLGLVGVLVAMGCLNLLAARPSSPSGAARASPRPRSLTPPRPRRPPRPASPPSRRRAARGLRDDGAADRR